MRSPAACLAVFFAVVVAVIADGDDAPLPPPPTGHPKRKPSKGVPGFKFAPPYYNLRLRTSFYIVPMLGFEETEMAPYMNNETILAHYLGHHSTYQKNMNKMHGEWREQHPDSEFAKSSVLVQMKNIDSVPVEYLGRFIKNAGGYINHAIYWSCISPNKEGKDREPTGDLAEEIAKTFGSFAKFKEEFTKEAVQYFGSGYVWLVREADQLRITATENQDCPISAGQTPLLVIDLWEHAYYLDVQFRRAKYVNNWWMLVDWDNVADMDFFWKTGEVAERFRSRTNVRPTGPDADKCLKMEPEPAADKVADVPTAEKQEKQEL